MLTLADAARLLKVSERTIRREIADGRLVALQVRGAIRIEPTELARYIAAARGSACPSAKSATDGKFDCVSAVADALSARYRQALPAATRKPSKIRSGVRKSTLRLVAGPQRP